MRPDAGRLPGCLGEQVAMASGGHLHGGMEHRSDQTWGLSRTKARNRVCVSRSAGYPPASLQDARYALVALLGGDGALIHGFEAEACDPIHGNCLHLAVRRKGESDLSGITRRSGRMRLALPNGRLFAFQFCQA